MSLGVKGVLRSSSMNSVIKDMVSQHCQSDSLNIEATPTTSAKILNSPTLPKTDHIIVPGCRIGISTPEQIPKSRCSDPPLA